MFRFRRSPMFANGPLGPVLSHPLTLSTILLIAGAQTAFYLQNPQGELPEMVEVVLFANWLLLFFYGLGYLTSLGLKIGALVSGSARPSAEPHHHTAAFTWKFFLFSREAAAVVLTVATVWTAMDANRQRPVLENRIVSCASALDEPGRRHLAKNLTPTISAAQFEELCLSAFLENRKAAPPPQSREELLRRYGPK